MDELEQLKKRNAELEALFRDLLPLLEAARPLVLTYLKVKDAAAE